VHSQTSEIWRDLARVDKSMAVDLHRKPMNFEGKGGFIILHSRTLIDFWHSDFQAVADEPIYVMILGR